MQKNKKLCIHTKENLLPHYRIQRSCQKNPPFAQKSPTCVHDSPVYTKRALHPCTTAFYTPKELFLRECRALLYGCRAVFVYTGLYIRTRQPCIRQKSFKFVHNSPVYIKKNIRIYTTALYILKKTYTCTQQPCRQKKACCAMQTSLHSRQKSTYFLPHYTRSRHNWRFSN